MKDIQKAFKLPLSAYSKRDLEELRENTAMHKKTLMKNSKSKALKKAKHGLDTPKKKWGAKQGNWHKVMPGDRY